MLHRIEPTGFCWLWKGALKDGYGSQHSEGKTWQAHRLIYTLLVGPIPEGLDLDHLCRVRHCVNPDHLEPVTRAENLRRSKNIGKGDPWKNRRLVAGNRKIGHCANGHRWTDETLILTITPKGYTQRHCRECKRSYGYKKRRAAGITERVKRGSYGPRDPVMERDQTADAA